jgi:SpoVK/Ycf46/Vps4 family AAA+-type ATPase
MCDNLGRLDQLIYVPPPSLEDRRHILSLYMEKTPFEKTLANRLLQDDHLLEGYTGADIAAVVRMAALYALRRTSSLDEVSVTVIS